MTDEQYKTINNYIEYYSGGYIWYEVIITPSTDKKYSEILLKATKRLVNNEFVENIIYINPTTDENIDILIRVMKEEMKKEREDKIWKQKKY